MHLMRYIADFFTEWNKFILRYELYLKNNNIVNKLSTYSISAAVLLINSKSPFNFEKGEKTIKRFREKISPTE